MCSCVPCYCLSCLRGSGIVPVCDVCVYVYNYLCAFQIVLVCVFLCVGPCTSVTVWFRVRVCDFDACACLHMPVIVCVPLCVCMGDILG